MSQPTVAGPGVPLWVVASVRDGGRGAGVMACLAGRDGCELGLERAPPGLGPVIGHLLGTGPLLRAARDKVRDPRRQQERGDDPGVRDR